MGLLPIYRWFRHYRYDFTVSSFNEVSGGDKHWIIGRGMIYIWRLYGRNLVVMYALKGTGSNKWREINSKSLDKIRGRDKCDAKWGATTAWNEAEKWKRYGRVNAVHVVRHGHGLRTSRAGVTGFDNFVCMRICKKHWFTGKITCEDHKSSLVIMFGTIWASLSCLEQCLVILFKTI